MNPLHLLLMPFTLWAYRRRPDEVAFHASRGMLKQVGLAGRLPDTCARGIATIALETTQSTAALDRQMGKRVSKVTELATLHDMVAYYCNALASYAAGHVTWAQIEQRHPRLAAVLPDWVPEQLGR